MKLYPLFHTFYDGICANMFTRVFFTNQVLSLDEEHLVGKITKHHAGFVKEFFTDTDHFAVYFPKDMDTKIKAVLIGACFLIVSLTVSDLIDTEVHKALKRIK